MKCPAMYDFRRVLVLLLFSFLLSNGLTAQTDLQIASNPAMDETGDPHQKLSQLLSLAANESNAGKAVEYAENAIFLADSLRMEEQKARALWLSGIAWKIWGDNLKSTERLMQAMELYSLMGIKGEAARVQRDLGETYRSARGFDFSENTLQKALAYFHTVNDSLELAKTYNRLAATRFEVVFAPPGYYLFDSLLNSVSTLDSTLLLYPDMSRKVDSLKSALDKASELAFALQIPELIISNKIISTAFYTLEKDFEKTQAEYDKIIHLMHQYNDLRELPLVLINKARTYGHSQMNQPEKAIPLAEQALRQAEQNHIRMYEFLASEILHWNYKEIGDYQKAYTYANKFQKVFKNFHNEDLSLHLKTQELEFQIRERELELKNRRTQLSLLITSVLVIAAVFAFFSTILIRKNRKLAKLLEQLNANAKTISDKNKKLADANTEKDRFFSIIAHDLRSPFNAFLGFTELMTDESFELTKEEMKSYAHEIRKSALLLFGLLENLLEWSRLQRNAIQIEKQHYPLKRIITMSLDALRENASKKQISIFVNVEEDMTVHVDDKMIQSVFRNLISNAIKFTPRGGKVSISARKKTNATEIIVSDTGVGITPEIMEKLFRIDHTVSTSGTEGEPSTGLGLILCREFIERHQGEIWAESSPGKGSAFHFTIPHN
jgi:signal transduction histidine kinase